MNDLQIIQADARRIPLPDESVQCIVTSPPYWGLRKYSGEQESIWGGSGDCDHRFLEFSMMPEDINRKHGECHCGAWRGAFGLEPTIELYIQHTVTILRELRRVLRPDGVLFWNIGDSYFATGQRKNNFEPFKPTYGTMGPMDSEKRRKASVSRYQQPCADLKPKDMCLIPARVAIAAQADGWWVRSMIVWAKPNPMPESVTDRPTDAYEYIIMLTKSERYFWDADAVREPATLLRPEGPNAFRGQAEMRPRGEHNEFGYSPKGTHSRGKGDGGPKAHDRGSYEGWTDGTREVLASRNLRNVWMFATQPFAGAHFATFPEELPRRCILAATSAKGACLQCGSPWERVVRASGGTIGEAWHDHSDDLGKGQRDESGGKTTDGTYRRDSIGWRPTCLCRGQRGKTVPCTVLDPFGGSGTTGCVALSLRRRAVLVDVAYGEADEYRKLALERTRNVQVEIF